MSGYDQAMTFLALMTFAISAAGLFYANTVRRLGESIRRHQAPLAEEGARAASAFHPAK